MRLNPLFYPESVAVIGASNTPDKVGFNCLESIVYGGFRGKIYPVHPRYDEILGLDVYPDIIEIDDDIDLAIIALNQYSTAEIVDSCAEKGVRAIISIAGGFREVGEEGRELEKKLVERARAHGIPLLGPNTLGIINTDHDFYATFYPMRLKKGNISVISQSGGVGLSIIYKMMDEGAGINKWVGVGNRAILDFSDILRYLARDDGTDVIAIFMEGTERVRDFLNAVREAVPRKPVVVYKIGRSKKVEFPALTHTGSSVGDQRTYEGAFRQYGVIQAGSVRELVAKSKALALCQAPEGRRLAIFTISAGPSLTVLDALGNLCEIPEFSQSTLERIRERMGDNPPLVIKNPLDVAAFGFLPDDFKFFLSAVLSDPGVDMVLAITIQHKNWRFPTPEIIEVARSHSKPLIICYPAENDVVKPEMERLQMNGIPCYSTPEDSVWGLSALLELERIRKRMDKS